MPFVQMVIPLAKRLLLTALVTFSFCTTYSHVFGNSAVRTVALTGATEPSTGATITRLLTLGELNNSGQTAFRGELAGAGVNENNDVGIWKYGADTGLNLFLREGDEVSPGMHFTGFGFPTLNNSGHVAFQGFATSGSTNYTAAWKEGAGGGLTEVARSGNIAPGTDKTFTSLMPYPADNEKTLIRAGLNDFLVEVGLWRHDGAGNLNLIYVERDNAPGTNTTFSSFGGYSMNDAGQVVLVSGLMDVHGGATQTAGIWRESQNGLQLIARHGDSAPATAVQFEQFGFGPQPILDSSGRTSFVGNLMGSGVNGTNNTGIWSERGDNGLELVIRSGSGNAPGTAARFESFGNLRQNSGSQLAFHANLGIGSNSTNNLGIWSERDGAGLTLVARKGSAVPGSELFFFSFDSQSLAFNNHGQVSFLADIRGSSPDPRAPQFTGIWAQNRQGQLELIALEGELLNISGNPSQPDLRTIASLDFESAGFNDLGQLTFFATFSDGSSGIFISDLVAVPEPQSALLLLFTTLGLVRSRRINRLTSIWPLPSSARAGSRNELVSLFSEAFFVRDASCHAGLMG
jgi:hypothetical protein